MALTGTLKDFGIADILQLIGQQQKTGILHLKSKDREVNVHFVDGNVVKAESTSRSRKDLLGSMLVRAQVLEQAQLDRALELQRQTLRRLGDILVDERMVLRDLFREMYQLQTTETLYRLFHWKDGTYAFELGEVDYDKEAITPIRSENVLMEGFRMVDEWPMIRRRITSYDMTFVRLKAIAGLGTGHDSEPGFDSELDDAFGSALGEPEAKGDAAEAAALSTFQRKVYGLAEPERAVQEIIDRTRVGEFESCKALMTLVDAGFLAGVEPAKKGKPLIGARSDAMASLRAAVMNVVMGSVVLALVSGVAWFVLHTKSAKGQPLISRSVQELIAQEQEGRLRRALELHRLEQGRYPSTLEALVQARILRPGDLSYPYASPWTYLLRPSPESDQEADPAAAAAGTPAEANNKKSKRSGLRRLTRKEAKAQQAAAAKQAEAAVARAAARVLKEAGLDAQFGDAPYLLLPPLL